MRAVERLADFVRGPLCLDSDAARAIAAEGPDPSESGTLDERLAELRAALRLLPLRQRKIVMEAYGLHGGECRLQQAIAVDLGLSRQRVSQLLTEALAQLCRHLES